MKLIVIIPALNEEATLPEVIRSIPRKIPGITKVQILVIDDGSTDHTSAYATKAGADFVVHHQRNYGLARSFKDGVHEALRLGADIIVNTDADNQYDQAEIPAIVAPIVAGTADLVIGDRQVTNLGHMKLVKKYGNRFGSYALRLLTGTSVTDASSGFRAFTAECAQELNILSSHTYTHEMLIEAHFKRFRIANVPVTFRRRENGESRLISQGVIPHLFKSAGTIVRTILLYRALSVLSVIGGVCIAIGSAGLVRFLFLAWFESQSRGHIQSLIISSILIAVGINVLVLGFIADITSYNRRLMEDIRREQRG